MDRNTQTGVCEDWTRRDGVMTLSNRPERDREPSVVVVRQTQRWLGRKSQSAARVIAVAVTVDAEHIAWRTGPGVVRGGGAISKVPETKGMNRDRDAVTAAAAVRGYRGYVLAGARASPYQHTNAEDRQARTTVRANEGDGGGEGETDGGGGTFVERNARANSGGGKWQHVPPPSKARESREI